MHPARFYAAILTSTTTSGYALFETLIKGSTTLLGLGAGALGFAAGVYAWQTTRIKKNTALVERENALIQKQILEKQLSKL